VTSSKEAPKTIKALDVDLLQARRSVVLAKRKLRKLAKPLYVNCDASWRGGTAGLAYTSNALGRRTAVVACSNPLAGEYMALLMAMMDAEASELPGVIEYRVDTWAVADLDPGTTSQAAELRRQVIDYLARHPTWKLELVSRWQNWIAEAPARRALNQWENHAARPRR
jgi:dihydrodipicolinate synthase/N-acetylneuraminate lyase